MTARGLQLLLPDGLPEAEKLRAAGLRVAEQRPATSERTFWDTFDGRVHGAGLACASSRGRLVLLDATTYQELAAAQIGGRTPSRLLAAELPQGDLRERLTPIIDVRALTPVARLRTRTQPIDVLNKEGKVVVRLRAEEPAAVRARGVREPLSGRLHVAGVRGYERELDGVLDTLTATLGLAPATHAIHDDAVAASGRPPAGVSSKLRVQLDAAGRADAAAVAILRRLLQVIEDNMPGTLADVDTEFLHDLRVAVRRSRAMQRELAGVFPRAELRAFRAGFRELQAITGPTRDLDVQLLEFDELAAGLPDDGAGDVEPLRELLVRHLASERAKMERKLRSQATRALLDDWATFLDRLVDMPAKSRPDAKRKIADVAGERIGAVYRLMVKMGSRIDDASPAEALHDLRKKGKELRYLLEFFASLYEPDVVKPMVATLKSLQDVLGRFQDREVQADRLRELGDEVAALRGGAPALMAMGVLVQHLGDDQAHARAEFAARFADFAAKRQRALVKRTFA